MAAPRSNRRLRAVLLHRPVVLAIAGLALLLVMLVAGVAAGVALDQTNRQELGRERDGQITLIDASLTARVSDLQILVDRVAQLSSDSRRDLSALAGVSGLFGS